MHAMLMALVVAFGSAGHEPLPDLTVDHDNVVIDHSCRVVIPGGLVIADADDDGVIHVEGDHLTIVFAEGSILRGGAAAQPDDTLTGTGLRLAGHHDVTIRDARIEGYKVGIHASECDGLVLERARIDRNFRQRLKSTLMSEDQSDWLWPHRNDDHEWLRYYGAAVCIEACANVTVRSVKVRKSQNGIILDRVQGSRCYDNDCSFLSGWGLAMWRSSKNVISRNAFDFCIRGYAHGVYNRGQDSAGILCFEQCSDNLFIENSATHCGDGFFGFAGKEALGETAPVDGRVVEYAGLGCNRNRLVGNDFSYAAAHGVELTFSFDNRIDQNTLIGNGICGIWGGYSQRTIIAENTITDNGQPESNEGGGINIEHGAANTVSRNRFARNSVAVALWSDDDGALLKLPWAVANHRGSVGNRVTGNRFEDEVRCLRLRATRDTIVEANEFVNAPDAPDIDSGSNLSQADSGDQAAIAPAAAPEPGSAAIGETHPVNARAKLAGREQIIMGEWGPWDHASTMLRRRSRSSDRQIFEMYGDTGPIELDVIEGRGDLETDLGTVEENQPRTLTIQARQGIQVLPYVLRVRARGIDQILNGTLVRSQWTATVFAFTADPRTNLDAWRAESRSAGAVTVPCDDLGWMRTLRRGPAQLPLFREAAQEGRMPKAGGGRERYGVIARTRFNLPQGRWRFSTLSDDGVRVMIGGQSVIENWTHHAPEHNEGTYEQAEAGAVELVVEYFQLDGFATLEFDIDRVPQPPPAASTPAPEPPTSVP